MPKFVLSQEGLSSFREYLCNTEKKCRQEAKSVVHDIITEFDEMFLISDTETEQVLHRIRQDEV